jgi:hypothetical protein
VESIKKNHPDCTIDTFIHAWNFNTISNTQIDFTTKKHIIDVYRENSITISNDEMESLLEFYQPKKYLIENIDRSMKIVYDAMAGDTPSVIGWTASQFYSMQRASFLKRDYELETGEEYDWCIRYRFDLNMSYSPFDIPYLSDFDRWSEKTTISDGNLARKYKQSTNILYTVHSEWDNKVWPYYRVGDICFVSDSLTYDLACNFYDWLRWIPYSLFFHGASPEVVFCYYLNMLKIDIAQLYIDPEVLRDY